MVPKRKAFAVDISFISCKSRRFMFTVYIAPYFTSIWSYRGLFHDQLFSDDYVIRPNRSRNSRSHKFHTYHYESSLSCSNLLAFIHLTSDMLYTFQ
jgi:hypothetical protein